MEKILEFINIIKVTITMDINLLFLILVGTSLAAAAGFLGTFMVLQRMSLVGDALSHVALPGLAIALALQINPIIGAFTALFFAVLLVWYLGEKSPVYPEAIVGVIFTGSLALGMIITPEPELLEALFGNIERISTTEGVMTIALSTVVIAVTLAISKKLILTIISKDLAKSAGVRVTFANLVYLMLIGVVVALGVKFVGTLLTGALVIIPAAAAKNISGRIKTYGLLATTFGVFSAAVGIVAAKTSGFPSGPMVVLTGIVIFVITYLFKKRLTIETV